ncbi:hypothetical protein CSB20_05615 [bacterium DOLZORAL124_64_63]|nr:MAG: hypothetical protein CSB20_05615 [bacterium DOLZORAL124_64_63]
MKKLLILMLTLAAGALLTGCVQMNNQTEIKKDGSGTMDMTITFSDVMLEVMQDETAGDEIKDLGQLFEMDKGELKKKLKGKGVKIKTLKKGTFNGKQGMKINLEFKNLEGLSYAMNSLMGEGGGEGGLAIFDEGNGNYALRPFDYNFPAPEAEEEASADDDEAPADEMDPEAMQKQMELMGKLMGAMGEISISMSVTVPGDIVESNAPKVEGRTSTWTINAGNMMTAGNDMEPNIVFSAKGLKIKDLK